MKTFKFIPAAMFIAYGLTSFVEADVNFTRWEEATRVSCIVTSGCLYAMIILITALFQNENKHAK